MLPLGHPSTNDHRDEYTIADVQGTEGPTPPRSVACGVGA
jgi:hypothetical protein